MAASCQSCGAPAAEFACSRCKQARFCGQQCFRTAWKAHKPHCRPAGTDATATESPVPAASRHPWLVLRHFVSEDERQELLHYAKQQRVSGDLLPNPAGPSRFFRKLDATGGVTPTIEALTKRLEASVSGLCSQPHDIALGRVCSFIEPGGFIHEHKDVYPQSHAGLAGRGHLRANIVVQMEPSGQPIIAGQRVDVAERDVWIFLASHELHATACVAGPEPRIVYGFGWTVPSDFELAPATVD
eukprot:gnl/TRDRNA2_/TRDRNA2_166508_c0_seq1.p1 gnl/TRDRNA2_/TRDRNA2_166508_c0~~gnl/TRDRNA2_/TRDRNA2_166508_c0_seq1.p1  ORF type:complete len:243 (+),score=21.94 gnl/TRDRNA2_/TRDRNA2_166508_c0_seq1:74-802(+)